MRMRFTLVVRHDDVGAPTAANASGREVRTILEDGSFYADIPADWSERDARALVARLNAYAVEEAAEQRDCSPRHRGRQIAPAY